MLLLALSCIWYATSTIRVVELICIICTPTNVVSLHVKHVRMHAKVHFCISVPLPTRVSDFIRRTIYTHFHETGLWHIPDSDSLSNIRFIRGASARPDVELTVVLLYTSALITCQLRERLHQGCSLYLAGDWRRYRVEVTETASPWTDKPMCVCHFKHFRILCLADLTS